MARSLKHRHSQESAGASAPSHDDPLLRESVRRMKLALAGSGVAIWDWDLTTGLVYLDESWAEMMGEPPLPRHVEILELLGRVHPEDQDFVRKLAIDAVKGIVPVYETQYRVRTSAGNWKWVHSRGRVVVRDPNGKALRMAGTNADITELLSTARGLDETVTRLRMLFEASPLAIFANDPDGNVTLWNAAATRLFGWTAEETIGRYVPLVQESARTEADNMRAIIMTSRSAQSFEVVRRRQDGSLLNVIMHAAPVYDGADRVVGTIAFVEDVTRRRQDEARIRHMSQHDLLTGLANRALLVDRTQWAIDQASHDREQVAIIAIDLDNFKSVNNALGHAAGDALLRDIAVRLQEVLGRQDTLARQGGDEFLVLLRRPRVEPHISRLAGRLQAAIAGAVRIEAIDVTLSASLGIGVHPDDGHDAETLIRNAVVALHYAKSQGRGKIQFFSAAINARATERLQVESDLRAALEREQIVVHYQPQIRLSDRTVCGAEALVRWNHPTRGLVPPAEFVPIAEESGLIADIGVFVLTKAASQTADWRERGIGLPRLAVNLSIVELNEALIASTTRILRQTGADPSTLEFEVTESRLMNGPEQSIAILRQLQAMGISVALDDFGTGFSSLSMLKRLPIDLLKIDQSFVLGIAHDRDDAAIIRSIVDMAHSLKLRVVAEGVEAVDQAEVLSAIGCDEAQGFLFGESVPAAEFERRFLDAGHA